MMLAKRIRSSFLCLSFVAIAGCSGGGDGFATDPGESVLVASATSFTVSSSGGGYGPPLPQGAACDPGPLTYTVHLDSSVFDWDRCDIVGTIEAPTDYTPTAGSRTLSAAELDAARSAARMVRVANGMGCGADKPTYHMSVTSPTGTMVYGDNFYACLKQDLVYVESASLDNLGAVLRPLVLP